MGAPCHVASKRASEPELLGEAAGACARAASVVGELVVARLATASALPVRASVNALAKIEHSLAGYAAASLEVKAPLASLPPACLLCVPRG